MPDQPRTKPQAITILFEAWWAQRGDALAEVEACIARAAGRGEMHLADCPLCRASREFVAAIT